MNAHPVFEAFEAASYGIKLEKTIKLSASIFSDGEISRGEITSFLRHIVDEYGQDVIINVLTGIFGGMY